MASSCPFLCSLELHWLLIFVKLGSVTKLFLENILDGEDWEMLVAKVKSKLNVL